MLGELLEEMLKKLDQQMSDFNDLRAVDLFNAYYGGFDALKLFVGRAEGITGFSEVLIFRAIYHFLGGDFERVLVNENGIKWGDKYKFVKDSLTLAKSPTLRCDGRKYSPDIVVYRNNTPSTVIEIKIYPEDNPVLFKTFLQELL